MTEASARKKVDEARQKLKEAEEDVALLSERGSTQASFALHALHRKVEQAERELAGLEERSEAHAREKVAELRLRLEEELAAARKGLEKTRRALAEARNDAERWGAESLAALKEKAAAVEKKVEAMLGRKSGGSSGRAGASGGW